MSAPEPAPSARASAAGGFATTHWSVVLSAGRASPEAQAALAALCSAYWPPLYAFVRRQGHHAHEAEDLTQEFFARLLERNYLDGVDPARGKFRSFLLAAIKHFLANERDRAGAQKRGGGRRLVGLDFAATESNYSREPYHALTAEKLFDQRWALTLLNCVIDQLRTEYARAGKAAQYEALKRFVSGDGLPASYGEAAAALNISEGAARVAVHRLRRRYRELLRAQIAQTVKDPADVDEEIRQLFAALHA